MSETRESEEGGWRSLAYIVIAVIVLAIIYYVAGTYWGGERPKYVRPATPICPPTHVFVDSLDLCVVAVEPEWRIDP